MKIKRPNGDEVFAQLHASNCVPFIREYVIAPHSVTGKCELRMVVHVLRRNKRFTEGSLHGLHVDVGKRRTDFRSERNSVGVGSLQIVVDLESGRFYADIDKWNPYQDAVNWLGHAFGEVLPGWLGMKRPGPRA